MCLHTWRSHCVDDLLIVHHQQFPLFPLRRSTPSSGVGVRVPQIRRTFFPITTTESTQARLLYYHPWGCDWRLWITTKCA